MHGGPETQRAGRAPAHQGAPGAEEFLDEEGIKAGTETRQHPAGLPVRAHRPPSEAPRAVPGRDVSRVPAPSTPHPEQRESGRTLNLAIVRAMTPLITRGLSPV